MPKKTLGCIRKAGCHFLIQVKANAKRLYLEMNLCMALNKPISWVETTEKGHGRCETRKIELYLNKAAIPKGWVGIERLVKVTRSGLRNGKPFNFTSLYILSKPIDEAQVVAQGVRLHWGIENLLHWIKDVNLKEDDMTIKETKPATAVACLNTLALNLIPLAGYKPIKDSFALFSNKVNELLRLFVLKRNDFRT